MSEIKKSFNKSLVDKNNINSETGSFHLHFNDVKIGTNP